MPIRAGFTFVEWVARLTKGFIKATGKEPDNLAKLKINMEAAQRVKDQSKVVKVDFNPGERWWEARPPKEGGITTVHHLRDPLKKYRHRIRPGSLLEDQAKTDPYAAKTHIVWSDFTDAHIKSVSKDTKINYKQMEDILETKLKGNETWDDLQAIRDRKFPIPDPEDMASGGRAGYKNGGITWTDLLEDLHPFNVTPRGISRLKRDIIDPIFKKKLKWDELDEYYKQLEMDKDMRDPENVPRRGERYAAEGGIARVGFSKGKLVIDFIEKLFIKASNDIRLGKGKWAGLTQPQWIKQHDNLTKMLKKWEMGGKKGLPEGASEYLGMNDLQIARAVKEAEKKVIKQGDPITSENFGASQFAPSDESLKARELAKTLPSADERTMLKKKYPGISDDLLNKILIDDNPQRKADVMATMDEYLKLREIGKSEAEAYDIITRSFKKIPTKHASGGIAGELHLNRPGYALGLGPAGRPLANVPDVSLTRTQKLIMDKALELMRTEGLSGFEAMDKAEAIIKKQIFVEKGGSEYAEYIPKPQHEGFSMRTRQELPTGPHSDWRKFQVRDYVEDDPLQRVQTDYMHSPIIEVKKPTKELEAAKGGLAHVLGV